MEEGRVGRGWIRAGLWVIVAVELVSPVPAVLTLGAAYVLAVRPAWFLRLVDDLYADRSTRSA